jgi:site-specific DNA recombinase
VIPRAVIYCRVSTKEQAQNLSLPTQLRLCREYCQREKFEVAEVFEDAGESAKTTDRPELQRLIHFCSTKKNRVQFVIVLNLTRFSRNAGDHAMVRALLASHGVSLRSVTEPITDDPVGRLMENMLAAIAQFDNDHKAQRTRAGMHEALSRGHWTHRAPLGYVNGNPKAGEPSLRPDTERAPVLGQAFKMVATGRYTVAQVLRSVTASGLVTRNGRPLTPQTFGALLRNPIYAGSFSAKSFGLNTVRGDFEPLVSEVLFRRVGAVLAGPAPTPHDLNNPEFPLRRFVVCDLCATPLTGSAPKGRSRRYPYYHCRKCKGVSVKKEQLEARFLDLLQSTQPRPEFMRLFRDIVLDVWKARQRDGAEIEARLRGRLSDLEHRESTVERAFLFDKHIDHATYERQRNELRDAMTMVTMELENVRSNELDIEGLLRFSEDVLCNAARLWTDAAPEQKQRLQAALFPQGLRMRDGGFGTVVTSLAFKYFGGDSGSNSGMASPTGFEPVFWP